MFPHERLEHAKPYYLGLNKAKIDFEYAFKHFGWAGIVDPRGVIYQAIMMKLGLDDRQPDAEMSFVLPVARHELLAIANDPPPPPNSIHRIWGPDDEGDDEGEGDEGEGEGEGDDESEGDDDDYRGWEPQGIDEWADTQFCVGFLCYDASDYDNALRHLMAAHNHTHHHFAQYLIGRMYLCGFAVEEDKVASLKWFLLSAEQGNVWAQKQLGYMHHHGEGVAKDETMATEWYLKAWRQGCMCVATALWHQVVNENAIDRIDKLIHLGFDNINFRPVNGETPLEFAIMCWTLGKNKRDICQALVDRGAYVLSKRRGLSDEHACVRAMISKRIKASWYVFLARTTNNHEITRSKADKDRTLLNEDVLSVILSHLVRSE